MAKFEQNVKDSILNIIALTKNNNQVSSTIKLPEIQYGLIPRLQEKSINGPIQPTNSPVDVLNKQVTPSTNGINVLTSINLINTSTTRINENTSTNGINGNTSTPKINENTSTTGINENTSKPGNTSNLTSLSSLTSLPSQSSNKSNELVNNLNFQNIQINTANIKHVFLNSTSRPPNEGASVDTIEQLEEKQVNYTQQLITDGVIKNVPLKLNINLDSLRMQISKNQTVLTNTNVKILSLSDVQSVPLYSSKYVNIEVNQSWSILDIINKKPIQSWSEVFRESYQDLIRVSTFLADQEAQGKKWFPLKKDVFNALELTPLHEVKVVIIGQDPYPGVNKDTSLPIADGKAFSTSKINKIPASLTTVFKVMQKTVNDWKYPSHGDLTAWCKQGVLLLNKCLTLDGGDSGSHKDLWGDFITRIIHAIDKVNPQCVYVMWGNHAQQLETKTVSKNKLMSSHPSPQGARFGFNDCNHFNQINEILVKQGKTPINWNLD